MSAKDEDLKFMELALNLAKKGSPSPNPYVGAVIVKGGRVLGSGYHRKAGLAHAEIEALKSLRKTGDAEGATMYVTLEPCNHFGRTPPCAPALIKAGLARVVFAMKDPNPDVKGGGEEALLNAGLKVQKGLLENEARELNEVFVKYSKTKMPFVVVKAAMSMDGRIATRTGDSKWITGEKAREYGRALRAKYDAIVVGINTVLADDPKLTARMKGGSDPVRIVLDDKLRIPLDANVLADSNAIVATCVGADAKKRKALAEKGAKVIVAGKERVDLELLLEKLGKLGITSLLVEGGAEVQGSFLDANLADKFVLFIAPMLIGGRGAKVGFGGIGAEKLAQATKLERVREIRLGKDFGFEAYPSR